MGTNYIATSRVIRNPVRVQTWNVSIRAGDDFKLALTVYADDIGTPAYVSGSRSQIVLCPDSGWDCSRSSDYGWGWLTGGSAIPGPAGLSSFVVTGFVPSVTGVDLSGRINFFIPSATTQGLCCGRYRFSIQVDMIDGEYSQVEGILQVRAAWGGASLGHVTQNYFTLDSSLLDGPDVLAPNLNAEGVAVDADGFSVQGVDLTDGLSVASFSALLATLPTTLPAMGGVVWNNGGVISLS